MFKKAFLILFAAGLLVSSCYSYGEHDPVSDTRVPGVFVTRGDSLKGYITIFVDGERYKGKVKVNDKWGVQLPNGRHSIRVLYNGKYSALSDFYIMNNRRNFLVKAFENDIPTIVAW